MSRKFTNKYQFPNLKRFGVIKEIKELDSNNFNGFQLLLENEKEATETEIYLVITDWNQTWFEVQLPNGSYNTQFVYVAAGYEQAALDIAVDFLIDQDIAFDYCDWYEARDNDMVDEEGEVMDSICCGNTGGVYVPNTVVINIEES